MSRFGLRRLTRARRAAAGAQLAYAEVLSIDLAQIRGRGVMRAPVTACFSGRATSERPFASDVGGVEPGTLLS